MLYQEKCSQSRAIHSLALRDEKNVVCLITDREGGR